LSEFLNTVRHLIRTGSVRISEHGYDELSEDELTVKELLEGIEQAQIVEEYPDYPKGNCILLLQKDKQGSPVHVLWGVPKGHDKPVVLVTAYRPNPKLWDHKFLNRI
jgi:hypothetical protein